MQNLRSDIHVRGNINPIIIRGGIDVSKDTLAVAVEGTVTRPNRDCPVIASATPAGPVIG